MTDLVHLIYASRERIAFHDNDILELLSKARVKNKQLNITGMLLFDNGSFLQVLEGSESTINAIFEEIQNDERHEHITKIISEVIPKRRFQDWSMGYASLTREELEHIDGMNDFFTNNSCLADIDKSRAKKVLTAFANGRWRLA